MHDWLLPGTRAAVCLTIDDVHPGKSTDAYEAGGDLDEGALGHVRWLLERHPALHVTLFTTADWREISPVPTRWLLTRIPYLRDRIFLTKTLPPGTMRLDHHPAFVQYLKSLLRVEIGLHGLYHVHPGPRIPVEFQTQDLATCIRMLREIVTIFEGAGLEYAPGMNPPGWDLPPNLAEAMIGMGLCFVASARDIFTPISPEAKTNMSGLKGVSLIYPEPIYGGRLLHMTTNFQATSPIDRAIEIIEHGGLLAIKAHIIKNDGLGHIALDGMDALYRNYLDVLFTLLEDRYGEVLWWTSMGEIAARLERGDGNADV